MNKQFHQLVVASVVALLTSGTITLVGLSAAEDPAMHMEGGTPPPSGGSYSPPPDSGMYQQPSGGSSYQQPSGGSSYTQPSGDWSQHSGQPSGGSSNYQGEWHRGDANMGDRTGSSGNQPRNDAGQWGVGVGGGQHEGAGFQKDWGRGGTTAPAGMGNESHMGRFGSSDMDDSSGTGYMGKMGNRASGTKKMQDMSDLDNEGGVPGGMKRKMMHGTGNGGEHGIGVGGGGFDMSQFEQFVPKKSMQDVDALLKTIDTGDGGSSVELTAAQTKKVENALNAAEKVEAKAVSGIEAVLDKKPSKASAGKAMKYVLELVKQWVNVAKIADGISDAEGNIVGDTDETATRLQEAIAAGCEALNEHFGSSKNWKKGAVVCDKVMDQIGEDTEE